MWKKSEPESAQSNVATPTVFSTPTPTTTARTTEIAQVAYIGPSIKIRGEVTGEENLLVEGEVEGQISLKKNTVTIGKNGRLKANVYAREIRVEGEVVGDLCATEQVIVHRSGDLRGNISAPRVTLEDGAKLRGSVDMEPIEKEISAASESDFSEDDASEVRPNGQYHLV